MKIKNILHNATLRFWLLAAALIPAIAVSAATHYATSTSGSITEKLQPFTGTVTISFNDTYYKDDGTTGNGLEANKYYDNDSWYSYGSRSINGEYFDWKKAQAVAFRFEPGEYKITVNFRNDKGSTAAMWIYQSESYKGSYDNTGYIFDGTNEDYADYSKEISVTGATQYWWVGGKDQTIRLRSIKVEKLETQTAPELKAITEPYFWYYNGGNGFSVGNNNSSIYGNDGKNLHYRYLPTSNNVSASCSTDVNNGDTKYVYVNGEKIGGNNGNENNSYQYGSYVFKNGDAIGIKLAGGKDYRIKVYLLDRGNENANRVLFKGVNVETAARVENNVSQFQIKAVDDNNNPQDTGTRLITYEIDKADADVYWIKNALSDDMYIGGFEVLPKDYPDVADTFTGTSWYVKDNSTTTKAALSDTQIVNYAVSGNNVVVYGPAMALNSTYINGNTVMINQDSKIGLILKAGATINVTFIADTNVSLKITDENGSKLEKQGGNNGYKDLSYTNATGADKKIWITGETDQQVYISGFEVTQPVVTGPSIDNVTPISENYVWYPVKERTEVFGNNVYTDEHENVFVYTDFQKVNNTNSMIKPEPYPIHGKADSYFYRTDKTTQLGFKIAQGKKGVINLYYVDDGRRVDLFNSNSATALGGALGEKAKVGEFYDKNGTLTYVMAVQYCFDTAGGVETFWLKAGGTAAWFGGFEVLFEEANNGGQSLTKDTEYRVWSNATVTNALGEDTYPVFKSEYANPVGGASMMIYRHGTDDAVALGGTKNGVIVRVPAGCKVLKINGYLYNASMSIYKGDASAPNTSKSVTVTGSGNIIKEVVLDALNGVSGDVYWITSDNVAGAYLTSVTPKESFSELQPTDVNYIYKVDSELKNGVQVSGDTNGRVKFVDGGGAAWIDGGSAMKVLGTEVSPVAIENGTDYFAVKVDNGPLGVKTGYVKVYFNGGSSKSHVMEELPLDEPMHSGWDSSYDPESHTITFNSGDAGRGWWFGASADAGAKDLSSFNKINIELAAIPAGSNLQLVVQSTNGAVATFPVDTANKRILGDLTDQSRWEASKEGATFDIKSISQIYIQNYVENGSKVSVEIKSARLMNKPIVIATGTDENSTESSDMTEVFGGKIYNLPDGYLYEYPFDLDNAKTVPQLIWITGAGTTGTTNIAAIEVLYDTDHAKVVEWYVNKDTKMIVGSDDPAFTIDFGGETLKYPAGYDEYVTFYMSSGRQASVSFIMPEAVREIQDWYNVVKPLGSGVQTEGYVDESKNDAIAKSYGKHTITIKGGSDVDKYGINTKNDNIDFQATKTYTYNRNKGISYKRDKITGDLYNWYGNSAYPLPTNIFNSDYTNKDFAAGVSITATQKVNGSDDTETVGEKKGEWNIYMRFISFKAPEAARSGDNVTVSKGQNNGSDIYYTVDSSEPENLGVMKDKDKEHSATESYSSSVNVSKMNCIFKAAQYIETPFYFYDDISKGKDSAIGNVLKVVSRDLAIENPDPSVVYVKNNKFNDAELFNAQKGGYMLTIPTGAYNKDEIGRYGDYYKDKDGKYLNTEEGKDHGKPTSDQSKALKYYDQPFNAKPYMYLTLGGINHPYLAGDVFNLCGTNWKASNDGGLKTYLDSYQYKFDVDGVKNIEPWATGDDQNQNAYTECNGGVGGADTEDGGMFLQPISGTTVRFEPEYDGVITIWLRQNGCLDNNTQETGGFSRRPVYVMDENGRIMRRSTIRPTSAHYMGINGVWAINSSVCEQRSQVEHTWLAEVAKQVYENHPLYGYRFNNASGFEDRWSTSGNDHSGHILYGWWYKGFDLDANRSKAASAAHVSRFEYMEPELLYRSDGIFNMEMNRLGLENKFAKYGFELPNFQYVRYRIPVKAGKTYYIAGRGTKNGFAAIRFDALRPNTNLSVDAMQDLRYSDNPEVVENQTQGDDYLKVASNWNNNGTRNYKSTEVSQYDLTGKDESEVLNAYGSLETVRISDTGLNNSAAIDTHVRAGKSGSAYDTNGNLVGKTVDFELTRTFRAYNWHPIILPFSLSETRVEQYFGEGTVVLYLDPYAHTLHNKLDATTGKSFTSALNPALEGTKLSFTWHRYQMLYANTPAFICPTFTWSDDEKKSPATNNVRPVASGATSVDKITFKRVTLDGSNSRNFLSDGMIGYAISNDYEVVGSYDESTQTGDIYYINNTSPYGGKEGNKAELVHSENKSVKMRGTRVWIRPRSGAMAAPIKTVGSRGFSEFEDDSELTGISDIVADDYTIEGYDIEDDGVYDILGRKMGQGSLEGLQKGVYIFHGRKVYVR